MAGGIAGDVDDAIARRHAREKAEVGP
jgi:hypothetical protein